MALDKHRILSELNSVVNQLQKADCGCMGKLFSSPGHNNAAMNSPIPTYGGCGHHSSHAYGCNYGAPYAGEPYGAMNTNAMNRSCMSRCNPPQLYADTYNYLNGNLMQPVVQEVYSDLKSITPSNTVSNNPMAGHMGLTKSSNNENLLVQSNMGNANYNATSGSKIGNNLPPNITSNFHPNQQMGSMAGMGPQIVNMMMGDGSSKPNNIDGQNSQLTGPKVIDASQSSYGKIGAMPLNFGNSNMSEFESNMSQGTANTLMQSSATNFMSPQHMYGGNTGPHSGTQMHLGGSKAHSNVTGSQQMDNVNANPAAQQMMLAHSHPHGQHAQGVAKFNEMFPGVMQGHGGDLGFDPMVIAMQMNPANQQKVAIDTIQKIMNDNSSNKSVEPSSHTAMLQPAPNILQQIPNQVQPNSSKLGQIVAPGHVLSPKQQLINTVPNLGLYNAGPRQQVYTTLTSASNKNQQQPLKYQMQYQQPPQQIIDPNTGAFISPPNLPTVYEGIAEPHALISESAPPQSTPTQQMYKEPIFPVDSSKNHPTSYTKQQKYYEYNTLGQPVEMLPAKMYHMPESNLPQTLAPQHVLAKTKNDHVKYSNVKSTVSKTSLMQKEPVDRTPSRTQLQQIYNQYKGSQSYTQQNIKESGHGATQSEGHLKVNPGNAVNRAPVDRVGDTVAQNSTVNHESPNKAEHRMAHDGDMPVGKPMDDAPQKILTTNQSKCRNGLQDMTYTSYPTSAAWSFHGYNRDLNNLGYRNKYRA